MLPSFNAMLTLHNCPGMLILYNTPFSPLNTYTQKCARALVPVQGGSMRMTVSTCVMLLELTNNLALLPLVMLVLLVAKVGGAVGLSVAGRCW